MNQTEEDIRFQVKWQWDKYGSLEHLDDFQKDYVKAQYPQLWNAWMNFKNSKDLIGSYVYSLSQGDL